MKKLLYLLIFISFSTYGQTHKIKSAFIFDSTYHFEVKRAKINSTEPISAEVYQVTDVEAVFTKEGKNTHCAWTYGSTNTIAPENLMGQLTNDQKRLLNIYQDMKLKLLIDSKEGGITLLNYKEMKENILNAFVKMYTNNTATTDSAMLLINIKNTLASTYSTPELLISSYFPEINLIFGLYSSKFNEGETTPTQYNHTNPFGGEPFPGTGEIGIDSINSETITIVNNQKTEPEDVTRILKETLAEVSRKSGNSINPDEIPEFSFSSRTQFSYNINKELVTKVKEEKFITTIDESQNQVLEIILKQ